MRDSTEPHGDRGVYSITVAAELVGLGVQTLRLYEAKGLLEPERTEGGTRRYSADDLERLRRISELMDAGLNLAGVAMVLDLEATNSRLRATGKNQRARLRAAEAATDTPPDRSPRSRRS